MKQIKQMSVEELKSKMDAGEKIRLVDVREQSEYETARIDGSVLIPLSQFAQKALQELKPDQEIVVHCHHGGRSQRACEFLSAQGFTNLANLAGGIDAWSVKVDSKVPRY